MAATAERKPRVLRAGVDTWSPCWYVDPDGPAGRRLDELATVPTARGALLPDKINGHRVGWNRAAAMLWAEGHPGGRWLAPAAQLPGALLALERAMCEADVPVPPGPSADLWDAPSRPADLPRAMAHPTTTRRYGFAGVRRLDVTCDLTTGSRENGLAILAGVAAVLRDAPGKAEVFFGSDGGVETVYLRGSAGNKVLGRWYDKGLESGLFNRGELVRPEDQRRFVKGTRRDVSELDARYVRGQFHKRFLPLWKASKGVTVAGPIVLAEKLQAAVEAGDLTPAAAEKIAGHLLLQTVARRGKYGVSRTTRWRRQSQARELGLVLADGVLQEVEVDLHDVLDECMDTAHWGLRG